jgi:carbon-monoxide dehydrogenase medium subunit
MLLPKFKYHRPATLKEACEIKAEFKNKALILAGGTDVIVNMKKGVISPESLISLRDVQDASLKSITFSKSRLKIGAFSTASELMRSRHITGPFKALATGTGSLGSPLIRNMATIGGNLVTARPASDLAPSLMAYRAKVFLNSQSGSREVSLDEFFVGPGRTVIKEDEIMTEIILDQPSPYSGCAYIKLGTRKALEISLVNVAAFIALEKPNGLIKDTRIVLGAVGPTPIRALKAEEILMGQKPAEALLDEAAKAAASDSKPIDDFRGSAEYRRDMVGTLTVRALNEALNIAALNSQRR